MKTIHGLWQRQKFLTTQVMQQLLAVDQAKVGLDEFAQFRVEWQAEAAETDVQLRASVGEELKALRQFVEESDASDWIGRVCRCSWCTRDLWLLVELVLVFARRIRAAHSHGRVAGQVEMAVEFLQTQVGGKAAAADVEALQQSLRSAEALLTRLGNEAKLSSEESTRLVSAIGHGLEVVERSLLVKADRTELAQLGKQVRGGPSSAMPVMPGPEINRVGLEFTSRPSSLTGNPCYSLNVGPKFGPIL
jgi:hypothetical protein